MMCAENLLACVSLISWAWQNFVGMGMEKIYAYGYGKKFAMAWNFGHWKILLGMRFSLVILVMGLTLFFIDFLGESNRIGWCHQNIFGGKDQKSWTWEPTARISILCKSRRRHWRRLLWRWVKELFAQADLESQWCLIFVFNFSCKNKKKCFFRQFCINFSF